MSRAVEGGPALPVYVVGGDSDDPAVISGTTTANQGEPAADLEDAWAVFIRSRMAASADLVTSTANAAATIVLAATPGLCWCIGGVVWSYNATPTGGSGSILEGATPVFATYIAAAGALPIVFDPPKKFAVGSAVTVSVAAGGGSVQGRIAILSKWLELPD